MNLEKETELLDGNSGYFKEVYHKFPGKDEKYHLLLFFARGYDVETITTEVSFYEKSFEKLLQELADDNFITVVKEDNNQKINITKKGEEKVYDLIKDWKTFAEKNDKKHRKFKRKTRYEQMKKVSKRAEVLFFQKDKGKMCKLISDFIKENYFVKTIKDSSQEEIWIYNKGIYEPFGEQTIKNIVYNILKAKFKKIYFNRIKDMITSTTHILKKDLFREKNRYTIPVKNGLLDLKSGELKDFTPEEIYFQKIPVKYNPDNKCERIKKFLHSVLPSEQNVKMLFEIIGHCLSREYFIEKAVLFEGNGRNGKGKTLNLIRSFLGEDNITSLNLQELGESRFAKSDLHKKLANLGGDIPNTGLKDVSQFKGLTGRDMISADRKNLSRIKFENYATLIFSANQRPRADYVTEAFFSRWVILKFPYKFVNRQEFDMCNNRDKIKIRKPNVLSGIFNNKEEEFSGLLNEAVEGFQRLYNNDDFSKSSTTHEVKLDWLRSSNSFAAFCMDHVSRDSNSMISKSDIRGLYSIYCSRHNINTVSDDSIKYYLQNNFGVSEHRTIKYTDDNTRVRVWKGIKVDKDEVLNIDKGNLDNYPSKSEQVEKDEGLEEVGVFDVPEIVNFVKSFGSRVKKSKVNEKFSSELIEKSLEQGEIHNEGEKYYGV